MSGQTTTITLDTTTAEKLMKLLALEEKKEPTTRRSSVRRYVCRHGQKCYGWKTGKCLHAHPPPSCSKKDIKVSLCFTEKNTGNCPSPLCSFAHSSPRNTLLAQKCRHQDLSNDRFCENDGCRFSHELGNPTICNHGTFCVKWRGHKDFDEVECGGSECLRAHFFIKSSRKSDTHAASAAVDFSEELSNA